MLRTRIGLSVPLKSQNLYIEICDRIATFCLEQNYVNEEKINPIEVFYTFRTPANVFVYGFEAMLDDGTIVVAQCKKQTKEHNQAINRNWTDYYPDKSTGNICVALGNLAPLSGVILKVKFICELDNDLDYRFLRLNIPPAITNQYTPHYQLTSKSYADAITNPKKIFEKPYVLNIYGSVKMSNKLVNINAINYNHNINFSNVTNNSCLFEISSIENLTTDIVIIIERELFFSSAMTQKLISSNPLKNPILKFCTMINIVPDFSLFEPINVNNCHYCILIDRSGSMGIDNRMSNAKKAAERFVALIPFEASFDVYAFDDEYEKFTSSDLLILNGDNLMQRKVEASEWINNIQAYGGTELLPVLKEIYTDLNKHKNCVLIILTDGGIENTDDVFKLVKANSNVNVFSIGIGKNASSELVKGLAIHGNGHYELINSTSDNIGAIVSSQLQKAKNTLQKHQDDYKIEIDFLENDFDNSNQSNQSCRHIIIPNTFSPLYEKIDNTYFVFSEFMPSVVRFITKKSKCTTYTTYTTNQENESIDHWFTQRIIPTILDGEQMLHRIAGMKLINDLHFREKTEISVDIKDNIKDNIKDDIKNDIKDDIKDDIRDDIKDDIKENIITASIDLSILSDHTTFIAVENKVDKNTGKITLKEIPIQAPQRPVFDSVMAESASACGDRIRNDKLARAYGSDNRQRPCSISQSIKNNLNKPSNIFDRMPSIEKKYIAHKIKFVIDFPLDGKLIGSDFFTSSINCSFLDVTATVVEDFNISVNANIKFIVGDIVELIGEISSHCNGIYEIISLGSVDEPWVLQRYN